MQTMNPLIQEIRDNITANKVTHITAELNDIMPWYLVLEKQAAWEDLKIESRDFWICGADQLAWVLNHVNTDTIKII